MLVWTLFAMPTLGNENQPPPHTMADRFAEKTDEVMALYPA